MALIVGIALGAIASRWVSSTFFDRVAHGEKQDSKASSGSKSAERENTGTVSIDPSQRESIGITVATATKQPFATNVRLTGKVQLNQDRVAHVYPMVDGTVDSVHVTLGQNVKKDDLLVVIHSRDIGKAKLELYQARLQQEMAIVKDRLQRDIAANTKELLTSLREGAAISDIEKRFRNYTMGDFRERLLAAYSNYLKSQADVSRLEVVSNSGAIPEKQIATAKANRNADLATFQSRIEQIEYELATSVLLSAQSVKEADTRVAVAATNLKILGCDAREFDTIDPIDQKESISHYGIRAPFDGSVITKDVVLGEQVRPDAMVLGIADLSTVWIAADVYEKDVPLLAGLQDTPIRIRNQAWPDRTFDAKIFYTGEIMNEETRTIALSAIADNHERLLKPGMFVQIELPDHGSNHSLQVPVSAIQEHEGRQFVFVPRGDVEFERRYVTLGNRSESTAVILAGLSEGDTVVAKGSFVLKSVMLSSLMGEE